ncbi:Rha family transcriptional regulator [uncultured Cardiobacterium sp.]|uniref:Rha family transcriptional regulator n=1 Tax=uncultured Cardiobacterium sp. TaxID=417619 RepID=UPI00261EFFBF|nr:Rha family transcriptional regulator [uncultured Cardiobacterium sp.]
MSIKQLIPAELIETDAHGNNFTTSLKVAAYFGKKHLHVLRDIAHRIAIIAAVSGGGSTSKPGCIEGEGQSKSGLSPNGVILRRQARLPGFWLSSYQNEQGKTQPMYRLDRDAFVFLVMRWSGDRAAKCQLDFLDAFNEMEARLHAQENREAAAFYRLRAPWQQVVAGTLLGRSRSEIAAEAGYASPHSISAVRRRLRELGVLLEEEEEERA